MRLVEGGRAGDLAVVPQQPVDTALVVVHDVGGQPMGEGEQLVVRHDMVDQSEAERLLGGQEVAGERHLDGPPVPDGLGEQYGRAAARHDAEPGVGVGEPGAPRRHQERALQGHFEPTRHRDAVDRPDDGLADHRQEAEEPVGVALRPLTGRSGTAVGGDSPTPP